MDELAHLSGTIPSSCVREISPKNTPENDIGQFSSRRSADRLTEGRTAGWSPAKPGHVATVNGS
jgi:hypothetical protein